MDNNIDDDNEDGSAAEDLSCCGSEGSYSSNINNVDPPSVIYAVVQVYDPQQPGNDTKQGHGVDQVELEGVEAEVEEEEEEEEDSHTTTSDRPFVSRMEKDPLGIGLPLPVLVRQPRDCTANNRTRDPIALASTAPATSATQEIKGDTEMMETGTCCNNHLGMVAFSQQDQQILSDKKALAVERKLATGIPAASNKASGIKEDETVAMNLSLQEQTIVPGGYAIGGPGLDSSAGTVEEGHDSGSLNRGALMEAARAARSCQDPTSGDDTHRTSSHSTNSGEDGSDILVEATLVSDNHQEEEREDQHSHQVVQVEAKPLKRVPKSVLLAGAVLVVGLVVFGLYAIVRNQSAHYLTIDDEMSPSRAHTQPTNPRKPTLERIKEMRILRCGRVFEIQNFFIHLDNAKHNGQHANTSSAELKEDLGAKLTNYFVSDYCAAIAAAVLGEGGASEMVELTEDNKYQALAAGEVDCLMTRHPFTMKSDVYQETAGEGISYATIPYLYTGLGFAGLPQYVDCADDNIKTFNNCSEIKICISKETPFLEELLLRIPQRQIVVINSTFNLFQYFVDGICNVVASESSQLTPGFVKAMGYNGDLAVGKREYTTEWYALNSLDSDPEWADFLSGVTMALLAAEQAGITRDNATMIGETDLFGEEHKHMFIYAISAAGNFGEFYDYPIPRSGRNMVNNGTTGMLVSPPFGDLELHSTDEYPGPHESGTLQTVLERGALHCGVRGDRPGFAMYDAELGWHGIDIDFCAALASSLFDGEKESVLFHDVGNKTNSNGFVMLHAKAIDVYSGAVWTLQDDMKETTTGVGYFFSHPYFYGPVNDSRYDENLCLATRQDDPQWSNFVYWTAQSIVYAEEKGIFQWLSSQMPLVHFFGEGLKRMFRDAVHAVGNYGEVYERNLGSIIPRAGRNRLNVWEFQGRGPLQYLPPGFAVLAGSQQS